MTAIQSMNEKTGIADIASIPFLVLIYPGNIYQCTTQEVQDFVRFTKMEDAWRLVPKLTMVSVEFFTNAHINLYLQKLN